MHDNKKNLDKLISLSSTLITGNKFPKQIKQVFIILYGKEKYLRLSYENLLNHFIFPLTIKTHTKKMKSNGSLHIWVLSEDFTANFQ